MASAGYLAVSPSIVIWESLAAPAVLRISFWKSPIALVLSFRPSSCCFKIPNQVPASALSVSKSVPNEVAKFLNSSSDRLLNRSAASLAVIEESFEMPLRLGYLSLRFLIDNSFSVIAPEVNKRLSLNSFILSAWLLVTSSIDWVELTKVSASVLNWSVDTPKRVARPVISASDKVEK